MLVYQVLTLLLLPIIVVSLLVKGFRNRAYWQRWPERFARLPADVTQQAPYDYCLHAVSVGEVRAAVPLVKSLLSQQPNCRILVTTTTPTGSDMVTAMLGNTVWHCYLPYDVFFLMQRFAKKIQAKTLLVMETEIWPNLIRQCSLIGSHIVYLNVRLSARSYAKYAKLKAFFSNVLEPVTHFAAQSEIDKTHLLELGVDANNVSVTGSIKFDMELPESLESQALKLRTQLGANRKVWICGSTRVGEEALLLPAYQQLKQHFPELLLVLVPRHPERCDEVARMIKQQNLISVRRSRHVQGSHDQSNHLQSHHLRSKTQDELISDKVDVYLADTLGELTLLYAASDVAFVGGSLLPLGGQNILEPCALGLPVLYGPHMFNFLDISGLVQAAEAGQQVHDADELISELALLLAQPERGQLMGRNGRALIDRNRGALARTVALIGAIVDEN